MDNDRTIAYKGLKLGLYTRLGQIKRALEENRMLDARDLSGMLTKECEFAWKTKEGVQE